MMTWSVLLLSVLLMTAAAHDSEEEQKEVALAAAGRGPPENVTVITTLSPSGRGPPENVTVITTLSPSGRGPPENVAVVGEFTNALNVSWDPPEEEPSYYSVDDGTDNQVTYNTFFFIEGLQPCTFYSIIVTSVYRDTDETYPAVTDGSTSISVPPEPLCWFDNIETTSMTAFWSHPPIPCAVTNHNMSWTSHVLWNDEEDTSGAASVVGDHYTVRHLKPYTNVTVSVAAATDAGYGPPTTCWHVTHADNPGPPVIVDVTLDERLSSAVVTWTPPVRANGIIIEYMIDAVSERHSVSTFVVGTVLTAVVEDLQYCQMYDITVQASNEAGWGRYSNAWNISTCEMFDNKGMPDM